jgi:hypothetical protein
MGSVQPACQLCNAVCSVLYYKLHASMLQQQYWAAVLCAMVEGLSCAVSQDGTALRCKPGWYCIKPTRYSPSARPQPATRQRMQLCHQRSCTVQKWFSSTSVTESSLACAVSQCGVALLSWHP